MVGTIEEGKYADMVVVDGDPLTDITVLQRHERITAVVKDGRVYRGLTAASPYVVEPSSLETLLDPAQLD
jgi:ribosomal protein L15E